MDERAARFSKPRTDPIDGCFAFQLELRIQWDKSHLFCYVKERVLGCFGKAVLERSKEELYLLRGWDGATGIPTRGKLEEVGLKGVADELEKRGMLPP